MLKFQRAADKKTIMEHLKSIKVTEAVFWGGTGDKEFLVTKHKFSHSPLPLLAVGWTVFVALARV